MRALLIILLIATSSFNFVFASPANPPKKFSYQALIRDNNNKLIINEVIQIQFNLLGKIEPEVALFTETHNTHTNSNGQISLEIGSMERLDDIDWSNGPYYLKTEIRLIERNEDIITGIKKILGVPFAFYADVAGSYDETDPVFMNSSASTITDERIELWDNKQNKFNGSQKGDMLYWDGEDWNIILAGEESQILVFNNGIPQWESRKSIFNTASINITQLYYSGIYKKTVNATVFSDGGSLVYERGLCWDTIPNPGLENNFSINGMGIGEFSCELSSLIPNKDYYLRPYAKNETGISFGDELKFKTPESPGPIEVFTFNDGLVSDYSQVFPLFSYYDIKGTPYIIPFRKENGHNESYMNWSQVKEMYENGWDIQCHSYYHRDLTTLSDETIEWEMKAVNKSFQDNGLQEPKHHAFPFGKFNESVSNITGKYRESMRLYKGANHYYYNTYSDFNRFRIESRNADMTTLEHLSSNKAFIDDVVKNNGILVFTIHWVYDDYPHPNMALNCKLEFLEELIIYAQEKDVTILTISELLEYMTEIKNQFTNQL
jgi:peptidoglycan/xylan/chitin deacetylase (PgdA/CDA1 family)